MNQMIIAFVWNAPIWSRAGAVTIGELQVLALVHGVRPWLPSWFSNFSGVMDSMNQGDE
ncbi:MAG: hypothetical protein WAY02_02885 [Burkholderiaceae bacterium]